MKKSYVKKGLAVGVICLLMLLSIPMVSGEDIRYPREEGPYNVFICGKSEGFGGGPYTFFHLLPFWILLYPQSVSYHFEEGSVFFVNGEKQDIVYPAHIWLSGFKGYGQTIYMILLKDAASAFIGLLTGSFLIPRARVIGLCSEIIVMHNYSATL